MSDIIKLLPDSVANQIAAGEVIQRPASAVKEMLENAIDSGAGSVILVVKDAGKTLIQVTDNGCGMSETDARLCFERHATSKIREANDLFAIRTLGFRGEALASIAAIAQVELKTRRKEDELGICIKIEGSSVKGQEPCQCADGSSFSVKNLFYNVPARRNFLKSDTTEVSYIIEEFQRVALVNPPVAMSLFHNGKLIFKLDPESTRQRIVSVFGADYIRRLVPVETKTNMVNIGGFIGKPEFARKTRGEQYFFVNGRFVKHAYLHHAVEKAFEELLPERTYPSYFIYLDTDPKNIDINIHPTKTEVKFGDEKSIYMILRSAVRQALGKYSLTPSIDFDTEKSLNIPEPSPNQAIKVPEVKVDPYFNPFLKAEKKEMPKQAPGANPRKGLDQWEKLYDLSGVSIHPKEIIPEETEVIEAKIFSDESLADQRTTGFMQLHGEYVLTQIKSGLMVVQQQSARERIIFERLMETGDKGQAVIQRLLFPVTVNFPAADCELIRELRDEMHEAGFEIEEFGPGTYIINGVPSELEDQDIKGVLEALIENYKKYPGGTGNDKHVRLISSLARQMSAIKNQPMSTEEMRLLIDQLFACRIPDMTPSGKRVFITIPYEDLEQRFRQAIKKKESTQDE